MPLLRDYACRFFHVAISVPKVAHSRMFALGNHASLDGLVYSTIQQDLRICDKFARFSYYVSYT